MTAETDGTRYDGMLNADPDNGGFKEGVRVGNDNNSSRSENNKSRNDVHNRRNNSSNGKGGRGGVIWLTGLSGAGKTTLAAALQQSLAAQGQACAVLDGDDLRSGLNADLGFAPEDRRENVRRTAEIASLLARQGIWAVCALISPYRSDRSSARAIAGVVPFVEVYLSCPLEACESRDPKGLYRKARRGELPSFTGISAPYEPPVSAELVIDTSQCSVTDSADAVLQIINECEAATGAGTFTR